MTNPWIEKFPKMAYLYPTLLCNLKCRMCYSGSHKNREKAKKEELSLREYQALIKQLYEKGVREFDISGGEPFIRKDVYEIIDFIKGYTDTKIYLVCNGTLLVKEMNRLKKYLDKIDRLHVSLDSYQPEEHNKIRGVQNAFQTSCQGILELKKNNYENIGINFVCMNENQTHVRKFLDMVSKIGAKYINILRLIDVSDRGIGINDNLNNNDIVELYKSIVEWIDLYGGPDKIYITLVLPGYSIKEINKYRNRSKENKIAQVEVQFDPIRGCYAFGNSIAITASGNVTGCTAMVDIDEFYLGNIRDMLLSEIMSNWVEAREKIKLREKYLETIEPCCSCKYWNECRGGCLATAYKYYGTTLKSDPSCIRNRSHNMFDNNI